METSDTVERSKNSEPKPFRCTLCDILRERDSNHWWVIRWRVRRDGSEFIELQPWNSVLARQPGVALACGFNCLIVGARRFAQLLAERRTQPAAPAVPTMEDKDHAA